MPATIRPIEDRRFRDHFGVDPIGIFRALVTNAQAGGVRQAKVRLRGDLQEFPFAHLANLRDGEFHVSALADNLTFSYVPPVLTGGVARWPEFTQVNGELVFDRGAMRIKDARARLWGIELKGVNGPELSVTAGNASGVNDGACALLLASEEAAGRYSLTPKARVVAMATAGLLPRIMGFGPAPAVRKVLAKAGLSLDQMDVIELNEAFAAQGLAVLRDLGLADDDARVNPNGGAIAMGHPLGMSGARLVTTALYELHRRGGRYALCTMCIGVGQGIAMIIERV